MTATWHCRTRIASSYRDTKFEGFATYFDGYVEKGARSGVLISLDRQAIDGRFGLRRHRDKIGILDWS